MSTSYGLIAPADVELDSKLLSYFASCDLLILQLVDSSMDSIQIEIFIVVGSRLPLSIAIFLVLGNRWNFTGTTIPKLNELQLVGWASLWRWDVPLRHHFRCRCCLRDHHQVSDQIRPWGYRVL